MHPMGIVGIVIFFVLIFLGLIGPLLLMAAEAVILTRRRKRFLALHSDHASMTVSNDVMRKQCKISVLSVNGEAPAKGRDGYLLPLGEVDLVIYREAHDLDSRRARGRLENLLEIYKDFYEAYCNPALLKRRGAYHICFTAERGVQYELTVSVASGKLQLIAERGEKAEITEFE